MSSKRVLITGLSTYWGGRLAQALERDPGLEAIVGVDTAEPQVELERTEFVKVGAEHALLRRIVEAAEIDTVIDTRLIVDSWGHSTAELHDNNALGTMNILAACSGSDSPVRKLVFKSSAHYYGCHQDDPAFFEESMPRTYPPDTPLEREILEAEASVAEFAEQNPHCRVTLLRCVNVLGPDIDTSHVRLFSLPAVPMILGFDPRYQFVHEDDVVRALEHAVVNDLHGIFNVAADGVLALSEVAGLLGKPYAPLLPPWGTSIAAAMLRRLGLPLTPEALRLLRFGRGVDNRRFKATGFEYRYTSRETVQKLAEHLRLHPIVRGAQEPYRYEREVEEFLRWSPYVRRDAASDEATREQLAELERLVRRLAERLGETPAGADDAVPAGKAQGGAEESVEDRGR